MPSSLVLVRPSHWEDSYEEFKEMPCGVGTIPQGWFGSAMSAPRVVGSVGELTFWDPGLLRRTVWVVALALVPVGTAWLWWLLSRIVASARRDDPFNRDNARRLAAAGTPSRCLPESTSRVPWDRSSES